MMTIPKRDKFRKKTSKNFDAEKASSGKNQGKQYEDRNRDRQQRRAA